MSPQRNLHHINDCMNTQYIIYLNVSDQNLTRLDPTLFHLKTFVFIIIINQILYTTTRLHRACILNEYCTACFDNGFVLAFVNCPWAWESHYPNISHDYNRSLDLLAFKTVCGGVHTFACVSLAKHGTKMTCKLLHLLWLLIITKKCV